MRLSSNIARALGGFSLLDAMTEGEEVYYLIYSNTNEPRLHNKYLKEGFQHVSILFFNGWHWLEINNSWSSLSFNSIASFEGYVFAPYSNLAKAYEAKGFTIQKAPKIVSDKLRVPSVLTPFTCVEVCKAVLGISKFSIFTPYQLYNYVERLNRNTELLKEI